MDEVPSGIFYNESELIWEDNNFNCDYVASYVDVQDESISNVGNDDELFTEVLNKTCHNYSSQVIIFRP